ncbi:MAG: glycosyltransferase [Elusimicrobia bacterium]|nr:glycosyltransferase [Elusimicrobiota bacterium]
MDVSIVVPVYNECRNLSALYDRLRRMMETQRVSYEMIFVDDGSGDGSLEILKSFSATDPHVTVIEFMRNFGQHAAVMAGLERSTGEVVVTLDADLQNPPEEIPKLLQKMEEGYDTVGGHRQRREDFFLRKMASFFLNKWSASLFGLELKDYGCMLRAYRRTVVDQIVKCQETSTYIPALANSFAKRVTEIPVEHAARAEGTSHYSLLKLLRLNFDLMTGFSLLPIQLVGLAGVIVALFGLLFGAFLFVRRLMVGPEVEGVFTLFAIMFVFIGLQLLALGIVGEYVGRIYREVRRRPRSVVRKIYSQEKQ